MGTRHRVIKEMEMQQLFDLCLQSSEGVASHTLMVILNQFLLPDLDSDSDLDSDLDTDSCTV